MAEFFAVIFNLVAFFSLCCLIVGLIKPSIFKKYIKVNGDLNRKIIGLIFGLTTIISSLAANIIAPEEVSNSELTHIKCYREGGAKYESKREVGLFRKNPFTLS
jgi:hypothetical protein